MCKTECTWRYSEVILRQCSGRVDSIRSGRCFRRSCRSDLTRPPRDFYSLFPARQKKKLTMTSSLPLAKWLNSSLSQLLSHRNFISVDLPDPSLPEMWKIPEPEVSQSTKERLERPSGRLADGSYSKIHRKVLSCASPTFSKRPCMSGNSRRESNRCSAIWRMA